MHYFMLAQRQFYAGAACDAMITAMRLKLYEDVLGADDVSSLVALTSFHAGFYEQTSNAFLKLETHESVDASRRWALLVAFTSEIGFHLLTLSRAAASEAAIAIFNAVRPVDPKPKMSRSSLWDGGFEIMCKGCDKDVLRPWMAACPNCSSKYVLFEKQKTFLAVS
jgi:hypothetical protein